MPSQVEEPAATNGERQRLNGWKEIASYLGKGVRTVQRWEIQYQLPIRRIGRQGGEIVFAFKDEIDDWSATTGQRRDADQESSLPEPARTSPEVSSAWPYSRISVAIVIAISALGTLYLTSAGESAAPSQTVQVRIESKALVALDAHGDERWRFALDFEPNIAAYQSDIDESFGMKRIRIVDLDNDGSNEVVLWINSTDGNDSHGYRVFNADGTLRFGIEPSDRVRFGDVDYDGPWATYRLFVATNPDGTRSIWAAFVHNLYFPTLLLEVDRAGRIQSKYWSNGYIEDVEVVTIGGRRRVLVAGTHNDTRGASLAIFDYGKVAGAAPATTDKFRCKTCDLGGPTEFLVFPRQCIAEAVAGQAAAQMLKVDAASRISLFAGEGRRNPGGDFAAGIWYTIEPSFNKASMQFAVSSSILHRQLEQEGRLDHRFSIPAHLTEPGSMLKWNGSTFTTISVTNLTPNSVAP